MVFDVDGACLHVPFPVGEEKEGEKYACSIHQGAYKAFERYGLVFAYMGPPDEEPPSPEWEQNFTVMEGDELVPYSNFQHCNWLQVQDNAADNFHPTALHSAKNVVGVQFQGTTFDEVGAASMEVAPDMQFIPVHQGRSLACAGARRVNDDRMAKQEYELHHCCKGPEFAAFSEDMEELIGEGKVVLHFDGGDPSKSFD